MALILTTAALFSCILMSAVRSQPNICYEKADILFIMDASGSVGPEDFQKQLDFAATFIYNFQFGLTLFSVLRFETYSSIVIDFNDYNDTTALNNAILKIVYTGGGTNTARALQVAREEAFNSRRGARKGVPRIAIVSTDGLSDSFSATALQAELLQNSSVLVLSMGVGKSYNTVELSTIATYPEDVFEVNDYDQLVSVVYDYSELICKEVQKFKCSNQADIIFLFDSSSTIPQSIYPKELNYAIGISSKFNLSDVHIGAATFGGSTLHNLVTLGQFSDQSQLSQVLLAAVYLGGSTDTNSALQSVILQKLFDTAKGGRPDAAKILIILTDGGSVSAAQAKVTATEIRLTGVNIITIGVSNPNIAELKGLVNDPILDVVTNLDNPNVPDARIETLTAAQECAVPTNPIRDVSGYCSENLLVDGAYPHPHSCTKYLVCSALVTTTVFCPSNQIWDNVHKTCNSPALVNPNPCALVNKPNITRPPTTVTQPPTTTEPCHKGLLDVLLVLDSSDSVGSDDFSSELRDAANLAENFNLGSDAVLFAAESFGSLPHSLFSFNDFTDYKPLQAAILRANYLGGTSNTYLALENAFNILSAGNGSRETAFKVVILFSSGRTTDIQRTQQAATALKNAGVHIITVGYSNYDLQELQAIASTPGEAFVNNFDGILNAIITFSNSACTGGMIVCHGIQFSDVIFVLDSSASIADSDYKEQLSFVADITSKFTLSPEDVRFGAVIFSHDPLKLFDLKDFNTHEALRSAIMSAAHLNGGTDTALAINFVREQQMFSSFAGGRNNATKFVIILTDGRSNSVDETITAALRLKTDGVKFLAVGIGSEVYVDELQQLASDNNSLFLVHDFNALEQIKGLLTRKICSGSNLCSLYSWADGRHPNPSDCSTYVECNSFLTTLVNCPTGEAYDPKILRCTDKSAAYRCDDPDYFGPVLTRPPEVVVTTNGPTINDISNLCRDHNLADGYYPDPRLCNSIVQCTALITSTQLCPTGLNFNTVNNACDDIDKVDCQVNYHYYDIL